MEVEIIYLFSNNFY